MPTPSTAHESTYSNLISQGIAEALEVIPYHQNGPFTRRRLAGGGLHPGAPWHVAVHEMVGIAHDGNRAYCEVHTHTCDELNLLLSSERFVMRFTLGDEVHLVEAPASVYIPAGLPHSANVVEGTGVYLAIVNNPDYESSLADAAPDHLSNRSPR